MGDIPLESKAWRDAYRSGAHNVADVVKEELRAARAEQAERVKARQWELAASAAEAVRRLEKVLLRIGVRSRDAADASFDSSLGGFQQEEAMEIGITQGQFVVVRTYSAGVHVGTLAERNGKEVLLTDARRIWYWNGANTLHEIAMNGVGKGSKVSDPVPSILLTEAIEVIAASDAAKRKIISVGWAK